MAVKAVTLLGSTGSIGRQAEAVLADDPDAYRVVALAAGRDTTALAEQARRLQPQIAVVADPERGGELEAALAGTGIQVGAGSDAVLWAAQEPADVVVAGIVGAAGLRPSLAALRQGTTLALANKECLVCAGPVFLAEARRYGTTVIPVDSEHSALFQVFAPAQRASLDRLILTASGGPFRGQARADLAGITPAQAVAHPTWAMGAKISVDSATMMNKGLEIIEAGYLFDVPEPSIDVLIHPEAIVHSLVAYRDGAMLAELGQPDMRTPIAVALAWPERRGIAGSTLDLASVGQLTFQRPSIERFPALGLARQALRAGGGAPTVLNAANEIAVEAFLAGKLAFLAIEDTVASALERLDAGQPRTLGAIYELDRHTRATARAWLDLPEPGAGDC